MDGDPLDMSQAQQNEMHRVQRIVQTQLRIGLAAAVALMVAGLAVKLVSGVHRADAVRLFHLGAADSFGDLLMALGVLVLAATPAFRVVALVVLWIRERDWRFVGVAVTVMVTLAVAIVIGHG